jgi:DNA-binding LacI/PurR family transcriptional regulator
MANNGDRQQRDGDRPRRATIFDVAREANVSRGTVSRVLNGEPYVSAASRAAIEAAIAKVGYVRNFAARNLVTQRTRAVALIVHEPHSVFLQDPNIGDILLGTNERLSEAEIQLVCLIIGSDRDSARVADYLRGGFVDGAIIVSAREHDPIATAIAQIGLPAVFIGHPSSPTDLHWVGIDNRTAARDVTARLLGTGRTRVGMIAAALDRDSGADRLAGFREALGERFDPELVVEVPLYSLGSGAQGMRELLERAPDIDGVFASADPIAAGAMDVLREAGRRIPEDVGIVGFDDSDWALRCDPPLSTVRQPADLLGRRAATVVLDLIDGILPTDADSILPTEIVWRDSA